MNLREIIMGAVATLVVTVIGGVATFYWTKEPDQKKSEALYYSMNKVAKFSGGTTNVGFNIARIHNDGGVTAKNVVFKIDFPSANITDYSIESASGLKPKSESIDKQKALFVFESLVPSDAVTVSLLTTTLESPKISLRSNESLGKPEEERIAGSVKDSAYRLAVYYTPLVGGLTLLLLIYLIRGRMSYQGPIVSKNNMGFVLLHQELIADAESILDDAVLSGEEGPLSLSNLAVCRAKNGHMPEARSLIQAASFYAMSKDERAVVHFNDALVSLIAGDLNDFFVKLKEAALLAPKSIKKYCKYSALLIAVRSDPRYDAALTNT
jgi:hypothetical protein